MLDGIIARAAPPPERTDPAVFEPVATDEAAFARRLDGLANAFGSENAVSAHAEALGTTREGWLRRFEDVRLVGPDPEWAKVFRAIFERLSDDSEAPFAAVRQWTREQAEAAWPAGLPAGPDALENPLDYLARRLGGALVPTFHFENRIGSGPHAWAARFRRSPALAFALGRVAADWLADIGRIANCAAGDLDLISRRFFGGAAPGLLTGIEAGLGDPHAGGRSVAILHFERGDVVFKPKDLRVVSAVSEITGLLRDPVLEPPDMAIRDGYAWEAAYPVRPVADGDGADAFYRALGGWLALLQSMGAIDFWFDNLFADGATPRFVDFETAAQPPLDWPGSSATVFRRLPTGVGILPLLLNTRDGSDPVDIGCMARPGEHRSPVPRLGAQGEYLSWTEDRFAPRYADSGRPADAADHFDAFEDGYVRTVRSLGGDGVRDRMLDMLRKVGDAPVRIIRVDTWTCYRAIQESCLPRHLADGVWRDIALFGITPQVSGLEGEIREAAVRDLRRLDIPLFHARLDSRDLFGVEGERHAGFFPRDAVSETGHRLDDMTALAEDEMRALLKSGFSTRADNPPRREPGRGPAEPAGDGDLLQWADGIASDIVRHAVHDNGSPNWIGSAFEVHSGLQHLSLLGVDLLSGRTGLAGALMDLARGLNRPELAALARETMEGVARAFLLAEPEMILISGAGHVVGAGGAVSVLARDPELRPLAEEVWWKLADLRIWMRSGSDYVSGLDGWRAASRALGRAEPTEHGPDRPYAPCALPRLAPWLDPGNAVPLCADRTAAARLHRDRGIHGSWFADRWLDNRHDLSGVDGMPALAVRFVELAAGD